MTEENAWADNPDLSNEERIEYLRARGVQISIPSKPTQATGPPFKYIFIPYDERAECEELETASGDGDVLQGLLAKAFSGGTVPDEKLRETAEQAGQAVSIEALRKTVLAGGAETFRLAVPTDANGREAVYAYLDECAELKKLPLNPRANKIVGNCGFPPDCTLCGNVFIGRVKWAVGEGVKNLDFTLAEMDPSCLWQRRAPVENLQFQADTQPDAHQAAQEEAGPDVPAAGEGDGYSWKDQEEDVEITVPVGEIQKKDVKVTFKSAEVTLVAPVALSLKLFSKVDPDGCNWTLSGGALILSLEKKVATAWPRLLSDDGLQL